MTKPTGLDELLDVKAKPNGGRRLALFLAALGVLGGGGMFGGDYYFTARAEGTASAVAAAKVEAAVAKHDEELIALTRALQDIAGRQHAMNVDLAVLGTKLDYVYRTMRESDPELPENRRR